MQKNASDPKKESTERSPRLFIGLMSGTSVDSIDAALISEKAGKISLIDTFSHSIPHRLKHDIFALFQPGDNETQKIGILDIELSHEFSKAVFSICEKTATPHNKIEAIGSHGQTIRHQPPGESTIPFTLQIGDPNLLACLTSITTVADFRRKDMALGGHGAPLAPGFHHYAFKDRAELRVIVNIGGIANITTLYPDCVTLGYDTGPGNALMDGWIRSHKNKDFDEGGYWASQGEINNNLLSTLLNDPYFSREAPKSTGRERFNLQWLNVALEKHSNILASDVQATLCEVTAKSIADSILKSLPQSRYKERSVGVYICGGGAHNTHLLSRLNHLLEDRCSVKTTEDLGVHPDWVEAAAFAWLAMRRIDELPGNLPDVTGASRPAVLGGVYIP